MVRGSCRNFGSRRGQRQGNYVSMMIDESTMTLPGSAMIDNSLLSGGAGEYCELSVTDALLEN